MSIPLDPKVIEKREELRLLLDKKSREGVYQRFLERNPRFIPQEFVQNHGIHFDLVFRKLRLAENYTTDFFFISKSSRDWNLIFVELEKPHTPYFKPGSLDFHAEFNRGLEQVNKWRSWCGTPGNLEHIKNDTLEPVFRPLGMKDNPVIAKFVLVTGRREFLSNPQERRLVKAQERDFKIVSYDCVLEGVESNELVGIAVKHNEKVVLLSTDHANPQIFCKMEPSRLSISPALKAYIDTQVRNWDRIRISTSRGLVPVKALIKNVEVKKQELLS